MGYKNMQECIADLRSKKMLIDIETPLDADIVIGAVQRRVYAAGGPALMFHNPIGSGFAMLGNLFGTTERTRFIFRDTLKAMELMVKAKLEPASLIKTPSAIYKLPLAAKNLIPKKTGRAPVLQNEISLSELPQLKSWPMDGGAFITLPQVYSEKPGRGGFKNSNLGMYRVQISGNEYRADEAGLHYQIHRGLGVHHAEALKNGGKLPVNIFVGGPPSMTVAGVMPLPEGMPEVSFAGALGGRRMSFTKTWHDLPVLSEADFCICGYLTNEVKPEGPFGDHLGYYSLKHDFPVMKVEAVYHRDGAVWPFTTVGRPPQEDTSFGEFIHELTGELIPDVLPGVRAVHAVDAAGVHPLLFAIGSERYTPYEKNGAPKELLTQSMAILGQGQLSLAKYLFITNEYDNYDLDINNAEEFLTHVLQRADWRRDLHFHTNVTIDTLDYSGHGLNEGSKLVVPASGLPVRELSKALPEGLKLPDGFSSPHMAMNGVMLVNGPENRCERGVSDSRMDDFCNAVQGDFSGVPLIVVCDDAEFAARTMNNFLWTVFTRSNPASDVYGIGAFVKAKHFGCTGPLVIDARLKPHNAPPLEDDEKAEKIVDSLAVKGGPLYGII